MIEAVIFDLGGTLIEYAGKYTSWPELEIPGLTAAYNTLHKNNCPLPPYNQFQSAGFELLPLRWGQATRGEQNLTVDSLLGSILDITGFSKPAPAVLESAARQYESAICTHAVPIPNGRQILTRLKADGYRLGLISNTMFNGSSHKKDLERFGLAGYFETMLFSADVNKWKPTPAPFLKVAEELGIEPENAIYIGDDPASDVVGGRSAGMKTIHFPSSQRFDSPNGILPDATIQTLDELPDCLVTLNGA